jgi:hypothetical protein
LDSFERTILALSVLIFVISIPELPPFTSLSALKLYYDPHEFIHTQFWNFLDVNYYPFRKYPELLRVAWWTHFYIVSMSLLMLLIYAISRYFVSRRLSLLTVLAFISSWSIAKLFVEYHGIAFYSLFPLLLFWAYLWSVRSSTYRAGLFWGLVSYFGTLLNPLYLLPSLLSFIMFFVRYVKKTNWYKLQILRYMSFGLLLSIYAFLTSYSFEQNSFSPSIYPMIETILDTLRRKGVYIISLFGIILLSLKYFAPQKVDIIKTFTMGQRRTEQILFFILIIILTSLVIPVPFYALIFLALLSLLSMIPVELLFQRISRLRSSRNMIYAIYILLCLLDSHIEGRVKIFLSIFSSKL